MIIYWSKYINDIAGVGKGLKETPLRGLDLLVTPPQSLYNYLINNDSLKEKFGAYSRCTSALNELKKTYFVNPDFNYDFYFDENNNLRSDMYDQNMFDNIMQRDAENLFFINSYFIMFAEKTCTVTQMVPYLHKTSFSRGNCLSVTASLDISKWFRPTHAVYMNDEYTPMQLRADEPLYYLKFDTDEKIEFKEFTMNDKLLDYALNCTLFKKYSPRKNLNKLYDVFVNRNYHKKVLKEIKQNIVE